MLASIAMRRPKYSLIMCSVVARGALSAMTRLNCRIPILATRRNSRARVPISSMDSLEYRRVPEHAVRNTDECSTDPLKHLKRASWISSALFFSWYWRLHNVPRNIYAYFATASLLVFLSSFLYIVYSIRSQYGYSSAPSHNRWKHYAPRAMLVMSISSFLFYGFASVAYYMVHGILIFPGMIIVCYGASCLLSYL